VPPRQNYDVSKATFGTDLGLERPIVMALLREARVDSDGARLTWAVTQAITGQAGLASVESDTDILSVNMSANGALDLRPSATTPLPAGQLDKLDVVAFSSHTNVDLNLGLFKGVAILGDGNDRVTGSAKVTVRTGGGDDTIAMGAGADTIVSGDGNDVVNAGEGTNVVQLGRGDDSATTGSGNDHIRAGLGNDTVISGDGHDTIFSGSGNDSINAGLGDDIIVINGSRPGDQVIVRGGGGTDVLDLSKVVIDTSAPGGGVDRPGGVGPVLISLTGGGSVTAYGIERFVYDTDGTGPGGVVEVSLTQFLAAF
jgi:Ca2+-binding RTX toxin-like protein